jgi:hypothetical protein
VERLRQSGLSDAQPRLSEGDFAAVAAFVRALNEDYQ